MLYVDRREFLKRGAQFVGAAGLAGPLLTTVGCGGDGEAGDSEGLALGLFTDTSGSIAAIGAGHALAYRLAVEDVNERGGVLGKPVRFEQVDTESEPQAAIPKVRRLIESGRANVLIGGIFSSTREAVLPIIADQADRIYVYPMTYEGAECNENTFMTGAVAQQNLLPAVQYLLDQGARNWVLLGHDYVFPRTANRLVRELVESAGGTVSSDRYYPLDATDYSDATRTVLGNEPDAIVNNLTPPGMFTFYKQLGAAGYTNPVVATGLDDTAVPAVGAENLATTIVVLDLFAGADGSGDNSIVGRFEKESNGKVPYSPGLSYGGAYRAVRFAAEAVNRAESLETSAIRDAMVGLKLDDLPGGTASMGEDHHTAMNMYLARFTKKGSLELIEDLRVIQPEQGCSF
jgi:ABC-type branched-subunit amino acid transport system substrate-binding protein